MPVVLKPEAWPLWLGEQPADVPHLKALLAPYPSDQMICWPVSARVGNVKNNDPSLIEPSPTSCNCAHQISYNPSRPGTSSAARLLGV
jgi:putative SOS response-associated peptidase YedK